MDNLQKAKRIGMRNFLLEILIAGKVDTDTNMHNQIRIHAAYQQYLIKYPLELTKLGYEFIERWKDLK